MKQEEALGGLGSEAYSHSLSDHPLTWCVAWEGPGLSPLTQDIMAGVPRHEPAGPDLLF